ncbi:hypothetical protein SOMG_02027 [Schizosaccharomyces osmophilus]|uniref:Uncharacterized protein n=1 Tax=Schizosaccharomyces osmophilus TaxID=2545709 RepID=A0AAE9W6T3_9SCHI|nr:uncharacterized protein SOMG_02027 [Schizosaccharomyces osmophilus]WBW71036.1 hypothetical protein SOMG_02027 [Schizosaccharomyces osmophilus]
MNYYPYGILDARELVEAGKYDSFFEKLKANKAALGVDPTGAENAYSDPASSRSNGRFISTQGGVEINNPMHQQRHWWNLDRNGREMRQQRHWWKLDKNGREREIIKKERL